MVKKTEFDSITWRVVLSEAAKKKKKVSRMYKRKTMDIQVQEEDLNGIFESNERMCALKS